MTRLEVWFEFGSTYSYPAVMRVQDVATPANVPLAWRSFLLGPIFAAQGWKDSPFNLYPAKGRYMWRDLERTCAALHLPWRRPSRFPRNGLLAARVACAFDEADWLPDFVRGVYRANFAEDREIAEPEVVAALLSDLGQDAGPVLAQAGSEASKRKLRARTDEAAGLGIFGAPSFVVRGQGDAELFWGNDRLEAAVAACVGRPA